MSVEGISSVLDRSDHVVTLEAFHAMKDDREQIEEICEFLEAKLEVGTRSQMFESYPKTKYVVRQISGAAMRAVL